MMMTVSVCELQELAAVEVAVRIILVRVFQMSHATKYCAPYTNT